MHMRTICTLLAVSGYASAHFILWWPPKAGFDDDLEATAPCGSFTPEVTQNSPEVQVDRFAIFIQNVHPVGQWSFRATTDTKAPFTFQEIVPLVNTTGVGSFCLDFMRAPADFAGKSGVIQVVDNSPDGILYQCAPVNFVAGSNNTLGPTCHNASDFNAYWTNYKGFKGEKPAPSGSSIATHLLQSSMGASASSTKSGNVAAAPTMASNLLGIVGLLGAGLVL